MEEERSVPAEILRRHTGDLRRVRDMAFGEGVQATMGYDDRRPVEVSVFPETGVAYIHTPLSSITLRGASFDIDEANDVLEIGGESDVEWTTATVSRNGTVVLGSFPADGRRPEEQIAAAASELAAHEQPAAAAAPAPTQSAENGDEAVTPAATDYLSPVENQRLTLTGRIAKGPFFRERDDGSLIARFPLAMHPDRQTTIYRDVLLFGKPAERLQQDGLTIGAEVEAIGYHHEPKPGGKSTKPWLTAVAVKPVKRDGSPA